MTFTMTQDEWTEACKKARMEAANSIDVSVEHFLYNILQAAHEESHKEDPEEDRKVRGMREGAHDTFHHIRQSYDSMMELANVLGFKTATPVWNRLNCRVPFSDFEKRLILADLKIPDTAENRKTYFPSYKKKEKAA